MENKYYLDDRGLISLLKEVSASIKNHTSESIVIDNNKGQINNPNNLVTAKSVVNYLKDRKKLIINKDNTINSGDIYSVTTDNIYYNGEEDIELDIYVINQSDIENLFNN